jgi:hypothetical protein
MTKTIYISGPITDLSTGQPREGWQQDFLDAEEKLRRMGFNVINPVDIATGVESVIMQPTRADYIMACLRRMNIKSKEGLLHGVYVIGGHMEALMSHGVQMELLLAEVLSIPIYSECENNLRIDKTLTPMENHETISKLLNE